MVLRMLWQTRGAAFGLRRSARAESLRTVRTGPELRLQTIGRIGV